MDRKLIRIKLKAFVIKINCTKSTRLFVALLVNHIIRLNRHVRRHIFAVKTFETENLLFFVALKIPKTTQIFFRA